MTIGCNIWMICLKLNWFFYGLSCMLQFSQFVWALPSSVWDFFINFLLIDATDRHKISSDQKRFFIALSLYPLSFFANTPFKLNHKTRFDYSANNLSALQCSFQNVSTTETYKTFLNFPFKSFLGIFEIKFILGIHVKHSWFI